MTLVELTESINRASRSATPFVTLINYEMDEFLFVENPEQSNLIFFEIKGEGNSEKCSSVKISHQHFRSHPIPFDTYSEKFKTIQSGLNRGDSFLANLTIETRVESNLTLENIFNQSDARYKILLPNRFVCFSPETFITIRDGVIKTHPMKGTINASINGAEELIMNNHKEQCEHATIVDLLRNDISLVAKEVKVERYRYFDYLSTSNGEIIQVSSEISGKLPDNYLDFLGDIVLKLLPAGSICGAPKESTRNIIKSAEGSKRGFYTGIVGYFDGRNFDSAVLIRYIEQQGDELIFRSGGGITTNSDVEDEYNEAISKIYLPFEL